MDGPHQMPKPARRRGPLALWLWPLLLVGIVVAIWFLPWRDWLPSLQAWIEGYGRAGWIAYIASYVVVVALPLPAAAMSVIGGLAFGWWGLPLAMAGSLLGACLPFWATRHWFRAPVMARIGGPRIRAADAMVRDHAFVFVALLRVTPILPFTVQNYLLGLTSVRPGAYLSGTVAGLAPSTVALVWFGTLGGLEATQAGRGGLALSATGLAAFAALLWWATRRASRRLRAAGLHGRVDR